MASYWSIIVPEATRNYVENPSFEEGTTGYVNVAGGTATGTRTRVTDWQKRGIGSYRIVKTGGAAADAWGFNYSIPDISDFTSGDYATFSIDINLIAGDVHLQIGSAGAAPTIQLDITTIGFNRYTLIHGPFSSPPGTILLQVYIGASASGTFYADGLQVEKKSYATSYCDGDMEGCSWAGIKHASPSIRDPNVALGGREYSLDSLGYRFMNISDIGMPPIQIITQVQALLPGAVVRGYNVNTRTIQLVAQFHNDSLSVPGLHSLRKVLIDYLKPDRYGKYKPFILRYTGANSVKPIDFEVFYDGGLGYNSPFAAGDGFAENTAVRLLAANPFAKEDGNRAYSLSSELSLTSVNEIVGQENGIWQKLTTALTGGTTTAYVIKRGPDGRVYVGGEFTGAGGVATTKSFAVWNPETNAWSSLNGNDTSAAGGTYVYDIAFDALGNVYVCDNFTQWAGIANTKSIAKWTKSSATWSSITPTTEPNNPIYSMAFDRNGDLTVCGTFTSINGVAAAKIAKLSGTTWSAYSTGLANFDEGRKVVFSPDRVLYVGGKSLGANLGRVEKWTGSAFTLVMASNTAAGNNVYDMLFASNGDLYIAGKFTQESIGTWIANNIVKYNGGNFAALGVYDYQAPGIGGGTNDTIYRLQEDSQKRIWVGGAFTSAGGKTIADNVAIWNGSLWLHADIDLPASSTVRGMLIDDLGKYIGFNTAGTTTSSTQTSITYEGTSAAYPKLIIKRTGGTSAQLQWIENYTTGTILWFDYNLLDGETLTVDLSPGNKKVASSLFGTSWDAIKQTGDLTEFKLIPGVNLMNAYVKTAGSPTIEVYAQAQNTHWSVDGVAV